MGWVVYPERNDIKEVFWKLIRKEDMSYLLAMEESIFGHCMWRMHGGVEELIIALPHMRFN